MAAVVPWLLAAMSLAASGNLLLRRGMRSLGGSGHETSLVATAWHALRSPAVWSGSVSYVAAMFCWLKVLGRAEIGLAYPVFSGGATLFVMAGSVALLGERLERRRVVGALLVIAGIVVASLEP